MTIEERIRAAFERRPDRDDLHTAKALSVPLASVRAIRAGQPLSAPAAPTRPEDSAPAAGLVSLDRIRARYDIKDAIFKALAQLPDGKLLRESDLCQQTAGSDRNRFRRACENNADLFREHRVKLRIDESGDGTFYWGRKADVAEAIRLRDL